MNYLKQWYMPLIAVTVAIVVVVLTWRSGFSASAYANPSDSTLESQIEEAQTDYTPFADETTVYGKPPQELVDLIASQQGVRYASSDEQAPLVEVQVALDPIEVIEAESGAEYPVVYERGSWEAVFNHMPEEVTTKVNSARTVNFSNGVKAHICWCLGMQVQTYDPSIDVAGETDEGFIFYQHPVSRDLIITDNKTLVAYYDAEAGYTWTFSYDGSRAIRGKGFSFYAFANGRWTVAESSGSTEIKKDGIFQPDVFNKSYGRWTLDEILKVNDNMTQRFMTWFLPLNWEEIPWIQKEESVE